MRLRFDLTFMVCTTQEHQLAIHMFAKQTQMLLAVIEALKNTGIMTDEKFKEYQVLLLSQPGQPQNVMTQTQVRYESYAKMLGIQMLDIPPEKLQRPH
jgi:hypothetical protein